MKRAKPIGRSSTPIKRSRLKQGKGAKAERETPMLDAFRFGVSDEARGYCEVEFRIALAKPFPFYERISQTLQRTICGTDDRHAGENAHHVWPEDRDGGNHRIERGLWLCWRAHRWVHDNPAEAARLGLLRPEGLEGR